MNVLKNVLLLVASFFMSLIVWLSTYRSLPEKVIMHANSGGTTDYAHKSFMFLMFMIISLCVLVIFYALLLIDRKNENKKNEYSICYDRWFIRYWIKYCLHTQCL